MRPAAPSAARPPALPPRPITQRVARRPLPPPPSPAPSPNCGRRVAAAASSSSSSAPAATPSIPQTRDLAVAEAAAAVAASLTARPGAAAPSAPSSPASRGKKKAKPPKKAGAGFAPAAAARAVVELPLADESPAAAAALAVDLLAALPPAVAAAAHVACGDVDVALGVSDALAGTPVPVVGGGDDSGDGDAAPLPPSAWLLLVAPPSDDDAAVRATLKAWRGNDVVAVNAAGADLCLAPPPAFGRGWGPAYVFQPVAVQGFLGLATTGGAVLAVRRAGGPVDPVWAIVDGDSKLIGRSQRRPSETDIQDAFLNAAAAASPITKGAAALKGFADAVRGKK